MKSAITTFLAFGMLALVGCNNGGGGSGNANPTPVCPANYVFDANRNACVSATGGPNLPNAPEYSQYYDYNRYFQNSMYGVQTTNGDMRIVHNEAYKTFLKEALAVCDRNIWGAEYGLADCNNWVTGSFQISWYMNSTMVPTVKFEAYPAPHFFSYTFSFGINGGGVAFNPLILSSNNTFNLINNSTGYEIRAQGTAYNASGLRLIQIQVHKGTLAQDTVTYELYYPYKNKPTKIATGKFKRY